MLEVGLAIRATQWVARAIQVRSLPRSTVARALALLLGALCISHAVLATPRDFTAAREKMVETIEMLAKAVPLSSGRQEIDASIHAPQRLHEEISADYTDMIYAATAEDRGASEGVRPQMAPAPPGRRRQP